MLNQQPEEIDKLATANLNSSERNGSLSERFISSKQLKILKSNCMFFQYFVNVNSL